MKIREMDKQIHLDNKHKLTIATIAGILFGIFDWFFTVAMTRISADVENASELGRTAASMINVLIWLVPILPVVYFAAKRANSVWDSVKTGVTTWSYAILSYYLTFAVQISLGNARGWEHLNIFSGKENEFWLRYWDVIRPVVLLQIFEWIWVAVLGGALIGAGMYYLLGLTKQRNLQN